MKVRNDELQNFNPLNNASVALRARLAFHDLSLIMNLHNVLRQNMEKMSDVDLINSSMKVKPLNTDTFFVSISQISTKTGK